ncbi:Os03g0861200 [Oryza sativa Japonica Group]|uniref:Os03g0861200 protein n=2 Tax=Oryza sativa subsp. japonica TaxID=39947 RepID=A0A0P0W6I2_ORYSJ|nr:hypothetical protein EE612_021803 [Oryza sativa]BAF13893.1 Os03g0861200 [Oryza sativa Japonica Group]BAS87490.1 Os03g0861200 [Oryza sativa Japonica Group]|eukprot:NP_001051979.1 Os03g0861200 [Oryza sativa Japonica Group]
MRGGVETTSFSRITTVFSTTTLSSLLLILETSTSAFFPSVTSKVGGDLPPGSPSLISLAIVLFFTDIEGARGDLTLSSGRVADFLWSSCIIADIFFVWVSSGMLFLREWSMLANFEFEGRSVKALLLGSASFFNLSLDNSFLPFFSFFIAANDEVDLLTAFVLLSLSLLAFPVF